MPSDDSGEDMLVTKNRTRSRIKRILAIALPVVRQQIRTIRVHGSILVALLGHVDRQSFSHQLSQFLARTRETRLYRPLGHSQHDRHLTNS
jgi:hypothetical protein